MQRKKLKPVTIRFEEDAYNSLQVLAKQRGEPLAVLARRMVEEALTQKQAIEGIDLISAALSKVVRRELKPVEDRMAKLTAKSAVAGATSMYLNYFVIQQALGPKLTKSAKEVYETARVKAVAYLKEPPVDE